MSSVVMAVSVRCWVHLVFYCTENFYVPYFVVIKMLFCNLDDSGKFHLKRLACDKVDL